MTLRSKYLMIASMDVSPEKEALFNDVYNTEHCPLLSQVPGIISAGYLVLGGVNAMGKVDRLNRTGIGIIGVVQPVAEQETDQPHNDQQDGFLEGLQRLEDRY